ncbi:hypothetical protein M4D76_27795 [Peribacillus frigoritolerans]|uniref:hypothetical protein n=1 Tax=Peribacillus frigoritolerans TaxID=450367 RepID=UPI0021A6CBF4|nr:hypothetical protein [Peribacillus frigoritolerans]MCT1392050.1 hypothetical protein [Peribacillus frigoritolerans]
MENTNILFAIAGDKIKLTNDKVCEFVKLKRTKFIGKMDGKAYDIPVQMFVEIIEKAEPKKLNQSYKKLKKGELFYIEKNESAIVFRFEELKNGKIIGINPILNSRTRIDISLYGGKVSELTVKEEVING